MPDRDVAGQRDAVGEREQLAHLLLGRRQQRRERGAQPLGARARAGCSARTGRSRRRRRCWASRASCRRSPAPNSSAQITRWTGTRSKVWANSSAPCSIRRRPGRKPACRARVQRCTTPGLHHVVVPRPLVELAHLPPGIGIGDDHHPPSLPIAAAGRKPRVVEDPLKHLAVDIQVQEAPRRRRATHQLVELVSQRSRS